VVVGIDESWDDRAALEVHHFGSRGGGSIHIVTTHGEDPPPTYRNCLGKGTVGIGLVDRATSEYAYGRHVISIYFLVDAYHSIGSITSGYHVGNRRSPGIVALLLSVTPRISRT
jgi:hypothetical protein